MVFIMTQIIYPFSVYALDIIEGNSIKTFNLIFNSIGYLILLFAILIYHETIILNFCELNQDIKIY